MAINAENVTVTTTTAGAQTIDLGKDPIHTSTLVALSGTYTGLTLTFQGSVDGTVFENIYAIDMSAGIPVAGGTTISSSDNSSSAYKFDSAGFVAIRMNITALTTVTSLKFVPYSCSTVGAPVLYSSSAGGTFSGVQTFAAGITFSGATGVNLVKMPDNLADAISIQEGTNKYLTFVTTDGSELISALKNITLSNATTPTLLLDVGMTNTGFIGIKGKTSGMFKLTTADATAQTLTVSVAAQTVGAATYTIPDAAGAAQTFVTLALAQTLTNKTLTAPVINGATAASGNFDLSGSTGTFLSSTGINTLGGNVLAQKGIRVTTNGATAITTTRAVTSSDSLGVFTVSQAAAYTITVAAPAAAGERYLLQLVAPGANDVSIVATGCTFEGTITIDAATIPATGTTLKFASGAAVLGDNIELVSTSTTKFLVRAIASGAGGITIA